MPLRKDTKVKKVIAACACFAVLFIALDRVVRAGDKSEIPSINGSVGSCSALFTVLDAAKKPVYDAKINVVIRYGFGGLHKVELQVGTDSDGKARVIGLPEKSKKPLEFHVRSGALSKTVMVDPTAKCESSVDVVLSEKQ